MISGLDAMLVRIWTRQGQPIGAGVLVADQLILTCAHVVNEALDLPSDNQDQPESLVTVDFPRIAPGHNYEASVTLWRPPAEDETGDVAGLEFSTPKPADATPARFVDPAEFWDTDFRALGFPQGHDAGVFSHGRLLGQLANGRVQLEAESEYKILPGFSGAPVWSDNADGVVGIMVTAETNRQVKAGFMIPTARLRDTCDILQCADRIPFPRSEFLPTIGGRLHRLHRSISSVMPTCRLLA